MASANFPNRPFRLEENVWLISQDVANNRSRLGWRLWIRKNSYSPTWTSNTTSSYEFFIDGARVANNTGFPYDFRNSDEMLLTQGESWITHNSDGTKTVAIAGYASVETLGYTQVESSAALPTIARASTPTFPNGSSFDAGSTVRINTNRASTSFTHSVNWFFGSESGSIANNVTTYVDWVPPMSMLTQIPNATSGSGHIRLYTWSGTTLVGMRDLSFILNAGPSAAPSTPATTIADQNSTVVSVVGALVQNLSNIKVTSSASGYQGSTIKSITNTVNGVNVDNGSSILITNAGTNAVVAKATDSRGRTSSRTTNISALAYSNPTITSFSAKRTTSSGTASDTGTYLRFDLNAVVSSLVNGTERNGINLVVRTRPTGGAWTTRNTINTGLTYNSGALITGGSAFPITSSFDVQVTLTDKVGRTFVAQTTVATASFTLDLNGKNVGVGKVHERGVLDVGGDVYINGNLWFSGSMTSGSVPNARLTELSAGLALASAAAAAPGNNLNNATGSGFYQSTSSTTNRPPGNTSHQVLVINGGGRSTQYASLMSGAGVLYKRWREPASGTAWTAWLAVGDERDSGWVTPVTGSGWGTYAGENVRYRAKNGFVHLSGRVTGTAAAGALIFTLPAAYRHNAPELMAFATHSDDGATIIVVGSDGKVLIASRAGLPRQGVSLAGVSFPIA